MTHRERWTEQYRVRANEVDAGRSVRIDSLLNYLQDAAATHAVNLGFGYHDMRNQDTFWVLSRLSVRINWNPDFGSEVEVETWPSGTKGPFAYRNFTLSANGKIFGEAVSGWLILDMETKRPHRPDRFPNIMNLSFAVRGAPEETVSELVKLPGPGGTLKTHRKPVCYTDIDMNAHANNVKLVEMALDAVDLETWKTSRLERIEVNFLAEALPGDVLCVSSDGTSPEGIMTAEVSKELGSIPTCRVRLSFRRDENA